MTTSAESVCPGALTARSVAVPFAPETGRLFRLPGVYRPQADTWLLAEVIAGLVIPSRARTLDLCTGTGVQAIALARKRAASVLAVDVSRRALASARLNALVRRLRIRLRCGDLTTALAEGPFDVVVANPPYVPSPEPPTRGGRAWDSGKDGRAVLDPLCENADALLAPGGTLLVVQSAMSGVDRTRQLMTARGLRTSVVRRTRVPFGPVLSGRIEFLEANGFVQPGRRTEELVVIRADR